MRFRKLHLTVIAALTMALASLSMLSVFTDDEEQQTIQTASADVEPLIAPLLEAPQEEEQTEQQPPDFETPVIENSTDIDEEQRVLDEIAQEIEEERAAEEKRQHELLIAQQEELQDLGWYNGAVDGIKGPLTEAAIENFTEAADIDSTKPEIILSALQQEDAPAPPPPPPEPEPEPQAEPSPEPAPQTARNVWDSLSECESGNWINGGASFEEGSARWDWAKPGTPVPSWGTTIHHGGLQFHPNTWSAFKLDGYPQYAYDATREQQIAVAERVLAAQGWNAWPTCARKLGLL